MRCPECDAGAAHTDAQGWLICRECGLVIDTAGRLERDPLVARHNSPVPPSAPLGSAIAARGFEYVEPVIQLRRADRYARRSVAAETAALAQFTRLKAALDCPIPLTTLTSAYARIRPATRGLSAVNVASMVFYETAAGYLYQLGLDEFLGAAGLTQRQYFQLAARLQTTAAIRPRRLAPQILLATACLAIARVGTAQGIPPEVLASAFKAARIPGLSPLARVRAGMALFIAYHHLKARGLPAPFRLQPVFRGLGVAPSSIYGKWDTLAPKIDLHRLTLLSPKTAAEVLIHSEAAPKPPLIRAGHLCCVLSVLAPRTCRIMVTSRSFHPVCPAGLTPRDVYRWWEGQGSAHGGSAPHHRIGGGSVAGQRALGSCHWRSGGMPPHSQPAGQSIYMS